MMFFHNLVTLACLLLSSSQENKCNVFSKELVEKKLELGINQKSQISWYLIAISLHGLKDLRDTEVLCTYVHSIEYGWIEYML